MTYFKESPNSVALIKKRLTKRNRAFARRAFDVAMLELGPIRESLFGLANPLPDPTFCNLSSVSLAARAQFNAVRTLTAEPRREALIAFFTDERCDSPSEHRVVDYAFMRKLVRGPLNDLADNFIAVARVGAGLPATDDSGAHGLRADVVALAWGTDLQRRKADTAEKYSKHFQPRQIGGSGLHCWGLAGARGIAAATATMWEIEESMLADSDARDCSEGAEADTRNQTLQHMQVLSLTPISSKTIISGGEGRPIARGIIDGTKAQARQASALGRAPIHRDAILHFWAEAAKELGDARRLPEVRFR